MLINIYIIDRAKFSSLACDILYTEWSKKNFLKESYGALEMACSKKRHIFLYFFLFLLQDKDYSCFVLKFQVKNCNRGHKISNLAAKVLIFKTLITSKLIDLAT